MREPSESWLETVDLRRKEKGGRALEGWEKWPAPWMGWNPNIVIIVVVVAREWGGRSGEMRGLAVVFVGGSVNGIRVEKEARRKKKLSRVFVYSASQECTDGKLCEIKVGKKEWMIWSVGSPIKKETAQGQPVPGLSVEVWKWRGRCVVRLFDCRVQGVRRCPVGCRKMDRKAESHVAATTTEAQLFEGIAGDLVESKGKTNNLEDRPQVLFGSAALSNISCSQGIAGEGIAPSPVPWIYM